MIKTVATQICKVSKAQIFRESSKIVRAVVDVKNIKNSAEFAEIYADNDFKKIPNFLKNTFEDGFVTELNKKYCKGVTNCQDVLKVFAKQSEINEMSSTSSGGDHWRQVMSKSIETKSSCYLIIGDQIHMVLTKELLEKFSGLVETQWDFHHKGLGIDPDITDDKDFHWNLATENFEDMEDYKVALMKRGRRVLLLFMEACLGDESVKLSKSQIFLQNSMKALGKDLKKEDLEDPTGVIKKLAERDGIPATFVLKGVALDKQPLTPGIDKYVVKDGKGKVASSMISFLPRVGFVQALIDVKEFKLSKGGIDDNAQSGAEKVEEDVMVYVGGDVTLIDDLIKLSAANLLKNR